jgi:hypothetical protein
VLLSRPPIHLPVPPIHRCKGRYPIAVPAIYAVNSKGYAISRFLQDSGHISFGVALAQNTPIAILAGTAPNTVSGIDTRDGAMPVLLRSGGHLPARIGSEDLLTSKTMRAGATR